MYERGNFDTQETGSKKEKTIQIPKMREGKSQNGNHETVLEMVQDTAKQTVIAEAIRFVKN